MTNRVRRTLPLHICLVVFIAAFSRVALFAQESIPAAAHNGGDTLPNTPSPKVSQRPPSEQLPEPAQGQFSSSPSQPVVLSYGTPGTHVTVLENTLIRVMTDQPLSSNRSYDGPLFFTLSEDVIVNHVLVIPRGVTVLGEVIQTRKAGVVSGSPELTLKLDSLDLDGQSYPIYTYQFRAQGTSKTMPTANDLEAAAVIGALAGGVVSARSNGGSTLTKNAKDMAAGAAVGADVIAAAAVASPRPVLEIPAESQMDFYLASPISIQPVSAKEAERLAQRLHPGGPVLYVRGDTP